ncbi:unnamed protein product [Pelagomonas calceolata]|uniref:Uncharacterized protein n=1 Tax=Pelagomonas calceolata TaxID=35677 RepID=A0A8J2SY36_9STRA|nr:unnamed protein product [Pelagomonas calceolata]
MLERAAQLFLLGALPKRGPEIREKGLRPGVRRERRPVADPRLVAARLHHQAPSAPDSVNGFDLVQIEVPAADGLVWGVLGPEVVLIVFPIARVRPVVSWSVPVSLPRVVPHGLPPGGRFVGFGGPRPLRGHHVDRAVLERRVPLGQDSDEARQEGAEHRPAGFVFRIFRVASGLDQRHAPQERLPVPREGRDDPAARQQERVVVAALPGKAQGPDAPGQRAIYGVHAQERVELRAHEVLEVRVLQTPAEHPQHEIAPEVGVCRPVLALLRDRRVVEVYDRRQLAGPPGAVRAKGRVGGEEAKVRDAPHQRLRRRQHRFVPRRQKFVFVVARDGDEEAAVQRRGRLVVHEAWRDGPRRRARPPAFEGLGHDSTRVTTATTRRGI